MVVAVAILTVIFHIIVLTTMMISWVIVIYFLP